MKLVTMYCWHNRWSSICNETNICFKCNERSEQLEEPDHFRFEKGVLKNCGNTRTCGYLLLQIIGYLKLWNTINENANSFRKGKSNATHSIKGHDPSKVYCSLVMLLRILIECHLVLKVQVCYKLLLNVSQHPFS